MSEELIAKCTSLIREAVLQLQSSDSHLDQRGAARYLGIGERTFEKLQDGIPHFRLGGRGKRLYRRSELDRLARRTSRTRHGRAKRPTGLR